MTLRRLACLSLLATLLVGAASAAEPPKTLWVYVGTFTGGKSKGIYLAELDTTTGTLTSKGLAAETANPSFLAIHPSRKFVFAVGEIGNEGKKVGAAGAFTIEPKTGKLTLLNQESSKGSGPCHITVDKTGKNVLVANYGGGNVAVLPIGDDGKLAPASGFAQHPGAPADKVRPLAHSINVDPENRFAVAADAGLDKVFIYRFDPVKGSLTPNEPAFGATAPRAGPRHFSFHPNGKYGYVCDESASAVTAFSYDTDKGVLKEIQTISTLPEPVKGNSTAEILVHPSGKFVYCSNRGHDSIAIFSINGDTGKLTRLGNESTQGKTPRNFGIDPSGAFLLAANQDSDNVVVFKIDPATGKLKPTGSSLEVPKPVCVRMMTPLE
jgi:6-phosphogluconolactonase